jgi:hypothetical protein
MILPDFILPSCVNQCWEFSEIDSIDKCLDINHFKAYPHRVVYQYNSRGFRDSEWPDSMQQLQQAIWCIGDSFTVGIGSPLEHTWPFLLGQNLNSRIINVSMDGASNEWIARKASDVIQSIAPKLIVIHWSYTHRREEDKGTLMDLKYRKFYDAVRDVTWPDLSCYADFYMLPEKIQNELVDLFNIHDQLIVTDEERRRHHSKHFTIEQDTRNTIECIDQVQHVAQGHNINLIHSFIPEFALPDPMKLIEQHVRDSGARFVPAFAKLDLARDGHHFDILTAEWVAKQVQNLLNL